MNAGVRPRKRFGQHFLVRPEIAQRIVALAEIGDDDAILEIGPGRGALSETLADRARQLVLIEIDRDLVKRLRESFSSRANVRIVEGDVLKMNLVDELGGVAPVTVVANLPYNISTPLISRFVEHPRLYRRLVLMLQWEVAQRICADPGGRDYGALSVMVQLSARARVALRVPPSAFRPQPKVDSAVIVIEPFANPTLGDDERAVVRRITRALFTQRRKQLGNLLRRLTDAPIEILQSLDIDPKRRPETLSPDDFVRLAHALAPQPAAAPAPTRNS